MRKQRLVIISLVFSLFLSNVLPPSSASAANSHDFNAGHIIDDALFTHSASMSVNQIQTFLNSKVQNCAAGYTCLKDYKQNPQTGADNYGGTPTPEGALTAAQIIKDYSAQFNINPQVILVTLQKENGLVTSTQPSITRYRQAMGYGCPDNRPAGAPACNPGSGTFSAQIYEGTRHFRGYFDASPGWWVTYNTGNNTVPYHPNSACGSSVVNIRNRATVALYTYTPYQPNQAALNAGYGLSSDGCSSYGNRNFFLFFTDWFGSTRYAFGAIPSSQSAYARSGCMIPGYPAELVGRLYNPDTQDFLYTTNSNEACFAVKYGYIWDGIVMKNAVGENKIPIYRLSNFQRHIFTSSSSVRDSYTATKGYQDEGVAFYAYSSAATGRIPVYGLQRDNNFFFTSAGREMEYYRDTYGFYSFGTIFYSDALNPGPSPIYRISRNHSRFYTISQFEKQNAITHLGFSDEGMVAMNDILPNEANTPIYRLRDSTGKYFQTSSRIERDVAVINYNYLSEGTGWYGLLWSNTPIYRADNASNGLKIFTNNPTEYNQAITLYGYKARGAGWYGY